MGWVGGVGLGGWRQRRWGGEKQPLEAAQVRLAGVGWWGWGKAMAGGVHWSSAGGGWVGWVETSEGGGGEESPGWGGGGRPSGRWEGA